MKIKEYRKVARIGDTIEFYENDKKYIGEITQVSKLLNGELECKIIDCDSIPDFAMIVFKNDLETDIDIINSQYGK